MSKTVTVPTDAVTLHRRGPDGELGEQIGEPLPVSGPGRVTFPPYRGPWCFQDDLLVAAWCRGEMMCWCSFTDEPLKRLKVHDGDIPSVAVPFTATLSAL
jgi:hypothetical protein